jgi:E3 ubiquitin-protein ligase Topors
MLEYLIYFVTLKVMEPDGCLSVDAGAGCSPTVERAKSPSPSIERAASPEPNCAICLGKSKNKCFTDSCLHQFCFNCLLEWSKVRCLHKLVWDS